MLVVDIDLVPAKGTRNLQQNLNRLVITNDGSGTQELGNYDISLYDDDYSLFRVPVKQYRIEGWDRSRSAVELVAEAFKRLELGVEQ